MLTQAVKATEYWKVPDGIPNMWESGGKFYCFCEYEGEGYGMMQSINAGEPNMDNGAVTWEEADITNAPRNAWNPIFASAYQLSYLVADRRGDTIYFAAQLPRIGTAEWALQVGTFDLATGTWGPQGTDNETNPVYPYSTATSIYVTDIKAIGEDDVIISYQTKNTPEGPGSTSGAIYGVRYTAGLWGSPFVIQMGSVSSTSMWFTHARLMYEPGSDYIHWIWEQDGGLVEEPNKTNHLLCALTYTISTDTVGTATVIEVGPLVTKNNGASQSPFGVSFNCNYGGFGFLPVTWDTFNIFWNRNLIQKWFIRADLNSDSPAWSFSPISTVVYEYDENARFVVNHAGDLLFVHTIGSNDNVSPPFTNANPQIAYRKWDGSEWGPEISFYTMATGFVWGDRISNNLPLPDAANANNFNHFDIRAIGAGPNSGQFNMPVVATSLANGGFTCFVFVVWRWYASSTFATATYFFRKASTPSGGNNNNVMFFGL